MCPGSFIRGWPVDEFLYIMICTRLCKNNRVHPPKIPESPILPQQRVPHLRDADTLWNGELALARHCALLNPLNNWTYWNCNCLLFFDSLLFHWLNTSWLFNSLSWHLMFDFCSDSLYFFICSWMRMIIPVLPFNSYRLCCKILILEYVNVSKILHLVHFQMCAVFPSLGSTYDPQS